MEVLTPTRGLFVSLLFLLYSEQGATGTAYLNTYIIIILVKVSFAQKLLKIQIAGLAYDFKDCPVTEDGKPSRWPGAKI